MSAQAQKGVAQAPLTKLQYRMRTLHVSATLAAAGGFLDGFTYVGHGHVFANAMTGNVVLLGVDAVSGSWSLCLPHLLPIVMFLIGVALADVMRLPRFRKIIHQPELVVLTLEILVLLLLSFLPRTTPDLLITMTIAFAASMQMATFREIHGRSYSSTFTTGNLRTMVELGTEWAFGGRKAIRLREARSFAVICMLFFAGATAGAFLTPRLFNRALWIEVLLLILVTAWLLRGDWRAPSDC
jgi:uncharacterized membrane protein YoaK (UPF0700 family)